MNFYQIHLSFACDVGEAVFDSLFYREQRNNFPGTFIDIVFLQLKRQTRKDIVWWLYFEPYPRAIDVRLPWIYGQAAKQLFSYGWKHVKHTHPIKFLIAMQTYTGSVRRLLISKMKMD